MVEDPWAKKSVCKRAYGLQCLAPLLQVYFECIFQRTFESYVVDKFPMY